MSDEVTVTPDVAAVVARWAGLDDTVTPQQLADVLEGVRQVVDRLYAVDVEDFEADYLMPDSRAR
jgi:hypothetical protein